MTPLDKIIIFVYLLLSLGSGVIFRGRQRSAQDYFTAAGEMPGRLGTFLVGLSIASSLFSAISFVAYPAIVYENGPAILLTCVGFPLSWLTLRVWFLPRYFAAGGATPYAILERRFGLPAREMASAMFILMRTTWMSAQFYAPTLVLMSAAGLPDSYFWPLVLVMGLVCTFCTTVGGLRGVVVTDAVQFMLIAVGLLFVIGTLVAGLPAARMWGVLHAHSGLWAHPLRFNLGIHNTYNFWALTFGVFLANLSAYIGDQVALQRYLSLGDAKSASRSFACNVFGVIGICLLLAVTGVLLRGWYLAHPDPHLPADNEKVLPYFIAHQLPPGLTGLLVAAILASTIGCITSSINSLAGSLTNDFIAPRLRSDDPKVLLRVGRWLSLSLGILSVFGVLLVKHLGTVFDIGNKVSGIFQGPLMGVLVLACLPRARLAGWAVMLGAAAGFIAGLFASFSSLNSIWVTLVTFGTTVVVSLALGGSIFPRWRPAEARSETA